ncbi:transcriptional regulator [Sphingorhabdus lutea]|uniref:Transcriptional regulator n=1 Tax=Sphingorhabdus lutea TaxID=1913578 RepID=A0A1L3J8X6_9SPHN|nr:Lrp/AsnC family transcriptional regulator [Sphingorhabdus lutea]APG61560.1 transcriptional regulator [Sphingorhabdus lutea]
MNLDDTDRKILNVIQQDSNIALARLAEMVGMSQTPCWKRVKKMEDAGIITGRVALVDREKVGLGVTVFVSVRTNQHEEKWLENFSSIIRDIPEVTEFYRMSGDVDYLLKIICADIADYDRIYRKMIRSAQMGDVSSSFAMEQIKYTTAIPL